MTIPNPIPFIPHTEMTKADLSPLSAVRTAQNDSFGTVLKETGTKNNALPKKSDPNREETRGGGGIVQSPIEKNQKAQASSQTESSHKTQKKAEADTDLPVSKIPREGEALEAMEGLVSLFMKRLNGLEKAIGLEAPELLKEAQSLKTLDPTLLSPLAFPVKTGTTMMPWKSLMSVLERPVVDELQMIEQIIQKLSLKQMDLHGKGQVTLELEPKELGALKVEIAVSKGAISAEILTQHPAIKEMLEKHQSLLMNALMHSGFRVDQFSVNVGDFTNQSHADSDQRDFLFSGTNRHLSGAPILAGIREALRGRFYADSSAVSLYV